MLTFANLRTRVLRLMDEATSTQTTTVDLVKDAINASHRRVLLDRNWPSLRWPREESFTTTLNQRNYALNEQVGKLQHIWDVTQKEFVAVIPLRQWQNIGIDRSGTDKVPPGLIYGAWWPVAAQPSAAGVINIISSSASDGTGEDIVLRGYNAAGALVTETLTANGTSTVTGSVSFESGQSEAFV